MKKLILLALICSFIGVQAQKISYKDYFANQTLRIDYNRCGTADSEEVFFEQINEHLKRSTVEASLENGILSLRIPKIPEIQPKSIKVKTQ